MNEQKGNKKIHYMWPVVLQEENIGVRQEYIDYVKGIDYKRVKQDNGSCSTDYDLLDNEVFKDLKETIINRSEFYLQDLFSQKKLELEIIASWCMKHKKGDFAQPHYHHNSYLSGVYYLQSDEHTGRLLFQRDDKENTLNDTIKPDVWRWNDINGGTYYIDAEPGNLIIFPSRLVHETHINKSELDRYCIAFNIMPRGLLGVTDHKWYIR